MVKTCKYAKCLIIGEITVITVKSTEVVLFLKKDLPIFRKGEGESV